MQPHLVVTSARTVVDRYCAAWNEGDPNRRATLLDEIWSPEGQFVDPMADLVGSDELSRHIATLRAKIVDLRLAWTAPMRRTGRWIEFDWRLSGSGRADVTGHDVAELDQAGRICRLVGFWDGRR